MRLLGCLLSALVALSLSSPASAAVEVTFVAPESYTDGGGKRDLSDLPRRDVVEREIRAHLTTLGANNLGPNQVLKVEITDIDLAGRRDVLGAGSRDIRVYDELNSPRIKLRFVLEEGGKTILGGEDVLSDPLYLNTLARANSGDPLRYERPMLTKWFLARIGKRTPG